ncbi:GntR family transcriptional regulator [Corynebacterium pseudodiphtheriticum]|nr:GntR family transcriptional regulator [Corynebacterium pseudodiphtheriticum]MDK4327210.1 GntR family transcriptional regulator [Corynebacterium pseudodiphtheriticum]
MIADSLAREITQRITRGDLRPGQRLPETRLARQLDCSRNSLREAFRFFG